MKPFLKIIMLFAAFIPLSWMGCETDETLPEPPAVGGKGGQATLRVIPQFDGVDVDSGTIYIIYNSLDNTEVFDDSLAVKKVEDGRPFAEFKGLLPGNYYLFGRGWDIKRSVDVSGGIAHTIEETHASRVLELAVRQ